MIYPIGKWAAQEEYWTFVQGAGAIHPPDGSLSERMEWTPRARVRVVKRRVPML